MFSVIARASMAAAFFALTPSGSFADRTIDYARFWATVSAVENKCDDYASRAEGFAWDDLNVREQIRLREMVAIEMPVMAKLVKPMSCRQAATYAAQMGGVSPVRLWEVSAE